MGANPSNARQRELVAEIEGWPGFLEKTCLTSSDVSGIAAAFRKASENTQRDFLGRVDFEHWLEMGDQPKPVESRLFDVFLLNPRAEEVSVYDFVVGMLNYCLDSKENMSRLAFDIYDRHTTGTITEADLEGMLIDVWGVNWESEERARVLLAERAGADAMQPEDWEDFCRCYPNLLYPIYKLQRTLQDFTIGKKRWIKVYDRQKKRKAKLEAKHARMMDDALTEEDKQQVMKIIQEEEANYNLLNGTKSQRIEAAQQATEDMGEGLLPGIVIKPTQGGAYNSIPLMTPPTNALDVQDRLKAVQKRANMMGNEKDGINWKENPLMRTSSTALSEDDSPKFAVAPRKVKGIDVGDTADDGGGIQNSSSMTPGSNGVKRSPLGSPINRQGPSRAEVEGSASDDKGGSPPGSLRIGGGVSYSGSTIGSPASGRRSTEVSDPRQDSRVMKPSSGDLANKRASAVIAARNLSATSGGGKHGRSSLVASSLSVTQRPSLISKSGRRSSVAVAAGASKRASVATYRENKRNVISEIRKGSQHWAGGSRKPSRAAVAAGS